MRQLLNYQRDDGTESKTLNSRSFSMIFMTFVRGTARNSASAPMTRRLRHCRLSVSRSCLPHPLTHLHKDHEKLIAHSKPSFRSHHSLLKYTAVTSRNPYSRCGSFYILRYIFGVRIIRSEGRICVNPREFNVTIKGACRKSVGFEP